MVDKQDMLEQLLNAKKITTTQLLGLSELRTDELTPFYERHIPEEDRFSDDDPQCVCGVYLSEHRMMGCSEGFQRIGQWEVEKNSIREHIYRGGDYDDEGRPIYDGYRYDDDEGEEG